MTASTTCKGPEWVNWDLTYSCPLRCIHCYSESGRRASKQISLGKMLQLADIIISARPKSVQLSGGEPLLVPGFLTLLERFASSRIPVAVYTSGWLLTKETLPALAELTARVHISLDGGTAETHDAIRGRKGSFDRAMQALGHLDEYVRNRSISSETNFTFGVDFAILQRNLSEMERLCSLTMARFPGLHFINFGAAVPSGLASREQFANTELLTEEQIRRITAPGFVEHLRALTSPSVQIHVSSGRELMMETADPSLSSPLSGLAHIEPDGALRCSPIYEGVVGNLLNEPLETLWQRAQKQRSDAVRTTELGRAADMRSWADATRKIDWHYGSTETKERIRRRPEYVQIQLQPVAYETAISCMGA